MTAVADQVLAGYTSRAQRNALAEERREEDAPLRLADHELPLQAAQQLAVAYRRGRGASVRGDTEMRDHRHRPWPAVLAVWPRCRALDVAVTGDPRRLGQLRDRRRRHRPELCGTAAHRRATGGRDAMEEAGGLLPDTRPRPSVLAA